MDYHIDLWLIELLTMALSKGLDGAIINPADETMKEAVQAYRVISGCDDGARLYIDNYGKKEDVFKISSNVNQKKTDTAVVKKN